MKVKDLIRELQKYNPEELVLVSGYEGGFESGIRVRVIDVHEQSGISVFGNYGEWEAYDKRTEPEEKFVVAIFVERDDRMRK